MIGIDRKGILGFPSLRIALLIGCLLLPAATPDRVRAQGVGATVSVGSASAAAGRTVLIPIDVNDQVHGVANAQLTLQYGGVLTVQSDTGVAAGPLIAGTGASVLANTNTPGQVAIGAFSTEGHDGPGTLVTVTAAIPAATPAGAYPLTLTVADLTDISDNPIPAGTVAGTLTVTSGGTTGAAQVLVGGASGLPGQTVAVTISANEAVRGLMAAQITLQFGVVGTVDASLLAPGPLVGGATGTVLGDDKTPGQVSIGLVGSQAQDGPGVLVVVPLRIRPATPPGSYALALSQAILKDAGNADIPAATSAGTLTVLPGLLGDVNGDGRITTGDVVLALRMAIGLLTPTAAQARAADVNGDGKVDVGDALLILRAVIGLINAFPPAPSSVPA